MAKGLNKAEASIQSHSQITENTQFIMQAMLKLEAARIGYGLLQPVFVDSGSNLPGPRIVSGHYNQRAASQPAIAKTTEAIKLGFLRPRDPSKCVVIFTCRRYVDSLSVVAKATDVFMPLVWFAIANLKLIYLLNGQHRLLALIVYYLQLQSMINSMHNAKAANSAERAEATTKIEDLKILAEKFKYWSVVLYDIGTIRSILYLIWG